MDKEVLEIKSSKVDKLPSSYDMDYKLKMVKLASDIIESLDPNKVKKITIEIVEEVWKDTCESLPVMNIDISGFENKERVSFKCSEIEKAGAAKVVDVLHERLTTS